MISVTRQKGGDYPSVWFCLFGFGSFRHSNLALPLVFSFSWVLFVFGCNPPPKHYKKIKLQKMSSKRGGGSRIKTDNLD